MRLPVSRNQIRLWMPQHTCAAIVVAMVTLCGCSPGAAKQQPSTVPTNVLSPVPAMSGVAAAALPAPEALVKVLSQLADPDISGADKVNLIEGATPEGGVNLDKFSNALRDGGYLPLSFAANDIAWSDRGPSRVIATIGVTTAHPDHKTFTFPMEFASSPEGWQLSRQTAETLLALGKSQGAIPSVPTR